MVLNDIKLGYHISTKDIGLFGALKKVFSNKANVAQIFLRSQKDDIDNFIKKADIIEAKKFIQKNKMILFSHSLVNIAKRFEDNLFNLNSIIFDMKKLEYLDGVGVIIHIGDYLNKNKEESYQNIKKSIKFILKKSPKAIKIIFENAVGYGTKVGFKFDELFKIYNLFTLQEKKRIFFCIDTAHSFAAGYDISNVVGVDNWFYEIDKYLDWNKVICIHLNDSKAEFLSVRDKHADLGYGNIGEKSLCYISQMLVDKNISIILEPPQDKISVINQIEMVQQWFKNK